MHLAHIFTGQPRQFWKRTTQKHRPWTPLKKTHKQSPRREGRQQEYRGNNNNTANTHIAVLYFLLGPGYHLPAGSVGPCKRHPSGAADVAAVVVEGLVPLDAAPAADRAVRRDALRVGRYILVKRWGSRGNHIFPAGSKRAPKRGYRMRQDTFR